jgi:hypothetical protein
MDVEDRVVRMTLWGACGLVAICITELFALPKAFLADTVMLYAVFEVALMVYDESQAFNVMLYTADNISSFQ